MKTSITATNNYLKEMFTRIFGAVELISIRHEIKQRNKKLNYISAKDFKKALNSNQLELPF